MLGKQKKGLSYVNLAFFSLAAAGLVGIVSKAKKLIKEKSAAVGEMLKK